MYARSCTSREREKDCHCRVVVIFGGQGVGGYDVPAALKVGSGNSGSSRKRVAGKKIQNPAQKTLVHYSMILGQSSCLMESTGRRHID
jgi:hypothetical protein